MPLSIPPSFSRSRMRTLTSFFSILALTFALGCGGGDSDPAADADPGPTFDAAPTFDAVPVKTPIATGLGQVCGGTPNVACADVATSCLVTEQNQPGFCSPSCAPNLPMGTNPDTAASQACGAAYTGGTIPTDGTPICGAALPQAPPSTNRDWFCIIACGVIGENDAGGCPGGMTCGANNACSP